ncbi:MAG: 1-acyl-sn-glycerol-3-phosphate acyltransferase [Clostridia bacterium]|nr:1-acyl-sn-glycerol-3-phosphate acyltransferase [Clostridia bacterium]
MKICKRLKIWFSLVRPVMKLYLKHKFNFNCVQNEIKPPFLILSNHTTDFDPFFVAMGFNCPIYFVMSDHVASLKTGKLIKHLVSPIPITKSGVDAETVKSIFSVIRQGGAVGLFPEGNKSFDGDMSWIKPSTGKLIKKLNCPIIIYKTEGGYFSSPRWTKNKRRGKVHSYISRIIYPNELKKLEDNQIYSLIKTSLYVNAYDSQKKNKIKYIARNYAKNIEAFLYACPSCGSLSSVYGDGDHIKCKNCDLDAIYNEFGYIENCEMDRLDKWDNFQKQRLIDMPFEGFDDTTPIFKDSNWQVQQKKTKYKSKTLGKFNSIITKNELILDNKSKEIKITLKDISGTAIEGACGIQLQLKNGSVYRMKNRENVNGLKYVNLISRLNNEPYKF